MICSPRSLSAPLRVLSFASLLAVVVAGCASQLCIAAQKGDLKKVEKLIAAGADVNAEQLEYRTPLTHAAYNGHREVVALLIAKGADVNLADGLSETPLMAAVMQRHLETAELLIERGANVNAKEEWLGWTPLLLAAGIGQPKMVSVLLRAGADVTARNSVGKSALRLATEIGDTISTQLLSEAEQKVAAGITSTAPATSNMPLPTLTSPRSIAVLPLRPVGGISAADAQLLGNYLLTQLDGIEGLKTVSQNDIQAALGLEKQKELLGCTELTCMVEISGALGVDAILHGELGKLGATVTVNVSIVDARKSTVIGRVSAVSDSSIEKLMPQMPGMVSQIVDKLNR